MYLVCKHTCLVGYAIAVKTEAGAKEASDHDKRCPMICSSTWCRLFSLMPRGALRGAFISGSSRVSYDGRLSRLYLLIDRPQTGLTLLKMVMLPSDVRSELYETGAVSACRSSIVSIEFCPLTLSQKVLFGRAQQKGMHHI